SSSCTFPALGTDLGQGRLELARSFHLLRTGSDWTRPVPQHGLRRPCLTRPGPSLPRSSASIRTPSSAMTRSAELPSSSRSSTDGGAAPQAIGFRRSSVGFGGCFHDLTIPEGEFSRRDRPQRQAN